MIRDDAIEIWKAGVAAVHGRTLVEKAFRLEANWLWVNEHSFDLDLYDRILVIGGGKFSHYMAEGIEVALGEELSRQKQLSGLVTVPDGSSEQVQLQFVEAAECRPAGINLPTLRVLDATERMIELLASSDERTLVLALISGGGSALLERSTLPLDDIIAATNWLSLNGANIIELNSVRIGMSDVKGGGLALLMSADTTMIGLIVSDVPGDDIRFVSSGPTVGTGYDTFAQAREVIARFDAANHDDFPDSVVRHMSSKFVGPVMAAQVSNFLIGNADAAQKAAVEKAISLGYEVVSDILADTTTCDQISEVVSNWCSQPATGKQCVISLGEPVVQPGEGAGQGGRNQHAVLATIQRLLERQPQTPFCFLSAGTDGEDGNTTVAGAHISHAEMSELTNQAAAISDNLHKFNSHPILVSNGLAFESGSTATNVADLRVILKGS